MKRILALDLDGTAVGEDHLLSEANICALRRMREAGHMIVIVTGRRAIENTLIGDICFELSDYALFNMGGTLIRSSDREILSDTFIDPPSAKRLIEHCIEHHLQLNVFSPAVWRVNKWTQSLRDYTARAGISPETYTSIADITYDHVEGMMATLDAGPIAEFLDANDLIIDRVDSEPGCIDILPKDLHKWRGVSGLLQMVGATAEQVGAIGDYDSDVSMLKGAGIGVAVANARPAAKAAADYITINDNNHSAVADAIDELVLGTRQGLVESASPATD